MKQKMIDALKKINKKRAVLIAIPVLIALAALFFFVHFSVREITVLGNSRYSKEEIVSEVCTGIFKNNTYIVSHSKKSYDPEALDLVDQLDVTMQDSHTLLITVQERQLVAYVKYLDCDIYFDGNGVVMDTVVCEETDDTDDSEEESNLLSAEVVGKTEVTYNAALDELPLVEGLSFESVVMGEAMGGVEAGTFNTIQSISRMINKYEISPERILFDEDMNITLDYGKITVYLGPDDLMEEKLTRMAAILKMLGSKSGELHLEDYDGSSENVIFTEAEEEEKDTDETETEETEDSLLNVTATQTDHSYALADKNRHKSYLRQQDGQEESSGLSENSQLSTDTDAGTLANDGTNEANPAEADQTLNQETGTEGTDLTEQNTEETQTDTLTDQTGQDAAGQTTQTTGEDASAQTDTDKTSTGSNEVTIDRPVLGNLPQNGQ